MENSEVNSNSVLDATYLTYPVSITVPQAAVVSQNKAVLSSLAHLEAHLKCLEYQCQCACPSADKTVLVEECLSVLQQNQELDARLRLASTRCETLEQHLKHAQVVVETAYTSQHEDSVPKHELRFSAPKSRSRALSLAFNQVTDIVSKPPPYVGFFPASAKAEDIAVNSPKSSFEISALSANIPNARPVAAGGVGMSPYIGAGDSKPKTSIMEMTVANPVAHQISSKICNVVSTALPLKPPQQLDEYPVRLVDTYAEFLPHKIQRKGKKKPKEKSKDKLLSPEQKVFNSASTQDRQIIETKFFIDHQPNSEKTKASENDKHEKPVTFNLNRMSSSISKGRDLDVVTRVIAGSLPIEITVSTVKSKVFDNSSSNPTSARYWIQSTDNDIEATKIRTPWATTNYSKN